MSDKLAYQAQLYFKGGGTEEEVIVKEFCSSWGTASKHIKVYFSAKHPNRPVACSYCLEGIAFGNRREMRKLNQKASVSLQSISHAVSAAASMPTSARAGRCCHLSGAQCPGLLGIYMLCTVNYQTQAGRYTVWGFQIKHICLLFKSFVVSTGILIHLQQKPLSMFCKLNVRLSVSHAISLTGPCPASQQIREDTRC